MSFPLRQLEALLQSLYKGLHAVLLSFGLSLKLDIPLLLFHALVSQRFSELPLGLSDNACLLSFMLFEQLFFPAGEAFTQFGQVLFGLAVPLFSGASSVNRYGHLRVPLLQGHAQLLDFGLEGAQDRVLLTHLSRLPFQGGPGLGRNEFGGLVGRVL